MLETAGRLRSAIISVSFILLLLLAATPGCGGSGEPEKAGELSIEELWARAEEADNAIESWHMEISSYYENTQYGSGQIQSIIIDVNGEDVHEQDLLLGQVYFEYMRVGEKQYNKDMKSGAWSEVAAEQASADASDYTSQFLELPSLAETHEHVGAETMEGVETEHFRFTLSPEGVKQMFSTQPSFDFSENAGGEVDVWIDNDDYFLVRYELVVRNVIIPEKIGHGNIRFVVSIRDINQPIKIEPPI
ncbi:MAG: hypothetical protein PHP28_10110 [Actinomycetota bacterium]|nr:hypothetical protein [Actinomycetota bacterium]MDD5667455.1 hypothetical protein [Actinomycetota bacterium]